jgi:hypothetical protein
MLRRKWPILYLIFTNFGYARKHVFLLIGMGGGGIQLSPFGTAATNRPIVPALGDYDDGEIGGMIGRGNRSIRRKPAPLPGREPVPPRWEASD